MLQAECGNAEKPSVSQTVFHGLMLAQMLQLRWRSSHR